MDTEEIESILNCPICMDEYNDPRILPCQHSFCEECLSTYIKDLSKTKPLKVGSFPCPICRHKTKLRNNVGDASLFEKDLTKIELLKSKDILVMQDSSDESDACVTQAMTTQTDDRLENKDVIIFPDSKSNSDTRKLPLQRIKKLKVRKNARGKEKKSNRITNIKGAKHKNKKTEDESDVTGLNDLDIPDYFLTYFIMIPLLGWRSTGFTKHVILAIFLFITIIVFTLEMIYEVPYAYFLCVVVSSLLTYRDSCEILLSHCNCEVRQYIKFTFCVMRISVLTCLVFFIFCNCLFFISFGATVNNALWTNNAVVSFHEFWNNFFVYQSKLKYSLYNINMHAYILLRRILNILSFLIWN